MKIKAFFIIISVLIGVNAIHCLAFESKIAPQDAQEQKALEVNGQSRNLNMMLVLRGEKDKIHFVKIRENYRNEILGKTDNPSLAGGKKEE